MRLWGSGVTCRHHRGYSGEGTFAARAKGGPENGGLHRDGKWGDGGSRELDERTRSFVRKTYFFQEIKRELRGLEEWAGAGIKGRGGVCDNSKWCGPGWIRDHTVGCHRCHRLLRI